MTESTVASHPGKGAPIASDLGAAREMHRAGASDSLRFLLRDRTRACHVQLEATTLMRAIAGGAPALDDVRAYLSLQLRLHAPMEAALAHWVPSDWAGVRLQKAGWLRRDLLALGPLPMDVAVPSPTIRSWAGALGMSYVLEGGTLGLQIVRKRLTDGHVGLDAAGRFLRGYGPDTGKRWQGFVAALDAVPDSEWPEAIAVAQATFVTFHRTFSLFDAVPA